MDNGANKCSPQLKIMQRLLCSYVIGVDGCFHNCSVCRFKNIVATSAVGGIGAGSMTAIFIWRGVVGKQMFGLR